MTPILLALALGQPQFPPFPGQPFPPPLPVYPGVPFPEPEGFAPHRPIGVETFARSFQPVPGYHKVWFLHPKTKRAVLVAFELPAGCGCPRVKFGRRYVKFDYRGHRDVQVNFRHNGGVEVEY